MLLLICGMFVLVACDSGAVVPPAEAEPAAAESNAAVEVAETSVPEEEVSDDAAVADAAGEGEAISEPTGDLSQGAASELTPLERDGMYSAPPEMVIDPAKFEEKSFLWHLGVRLSYLASPVL